MGNRAPELYISFDCETLGGNPFENYVFNWGFCAKTKDGNPIGELSINMSAPEGHVPDQITLNWFQTQHPDVYSECTKDPLTPLEGMQRIRDWIGQVSKGFTPILVCYPTIFDGTMLYNYWFRYLGHPTGGKGPGFQAIDIRSFASGKLSLPYSECSKEKALKPYMPKDLPHTHNGLDDAREQCDLFLALLNK
jgi:hypothetical protein